MIWRFHHSLCWLAFCLATGLGIPPAFCQEKLDDLLSQLSSDDAQVRSKAAESLAKIKPLDEAAIPALVKALDDQTPHSPVRFYDAARALANAGPKAAEAVKPRLLEKLRSNSVTSASHNEVRSLFPASWPALRQMLKDPEPIRRSNTLTKLRYLGQPALISLPEVKQSLADPDTGVHLSAAACYSSLSPEIPRRRSPCSSPVCGPP